jgi:hypothetical protein
MDGWVDGFLLERATVLATIDDDYYTTNCIRNAIYKLHATYDCALASLICLPTYYLQHIIARLLAFSVYQHTTYNIPTVIYRHINDVRDKNCYYC